MPKKEAKAGDSLKVAVIDGKIYLEYDKNDPHWGWLHHATDQQIEEFIQAAREDFDDDQS